MLLQGAPKCWEILEKSRVMCFRESFWRLSGLSMRERMTWHRGKVEGRKSSRVVSKSKHLHPHSGSSRTCFFLFFFFFLNIYLLIFGHAESSLLHLGFSLFAMSGGYSLIVVHRLLIVASSLVAEHRLRGPTACEIFPDQGLNLCPLLCRRRQWYPTPVLLPGKSHGWRSLVG